MTDPTPEDARSTYARALTECQVAIPEATAPCSVCVNHIATQERRAAEAAIQERCAQVADAHPCNHTKHLPKCAEFVAVAIRALGAEEGE